MLYLWLDGALKKSLVQVFGRNAPLEEVVSNFGLSETLGDPNGEMRVSSKSKRELVASITVLL